MSDLLICSTCMRVHPENFMYTHNRRAHGGDSGCHFKIKWWVKHVDLFKMSKDHADFSRRLKAQNINYT